MKEAYSGREAEGQSPTTPRDNPYRQTYSYDVWDNPTGRNGAFWRMSLQDTGTYGSNGRRQGWTYDEAGQVLLDNTGSHTFDARGSQINFASNQPVGGGQTGHPSQPQVEIMQSYDGQGRVAKRVETKRIETPHDPNDPNNPLTDIATDVTTTYYVRSSVLGGAAVLELDGTENKSKGHVYSGGGELARQVVTSTNPFNSGVIWQHGTPGTGSWVESSADRSATRMEMDPVGADVGKSDPFLSDPTPSYLEMRGDRFLYIDGGDPFDYSSGREIDGLPVSESEFQRRMGNGSIRGELPPGSKTDWLHSGGEFIYEQAKVKTTKGAGDLIIRPDSEVQGTPVTGGEGSTFVDIVGFRYVGSFGFGFQTQQPQRQQQRTVNDPQRKDDAGRVCRGSQRRNVYLRNRRATVLFPVPHTWLELPSGSWGWGPVGWAQEGPGQVEDNSDPKNYTSDFTINYTACPETLALMEKSMQDWRAGQHWYVFNNRPNSAPRKVTSMHRIAGIDMWEVTTEANKPGYNCTGWACMILESAGIRPPAPSSTEGMYPFSKKR